MEKQAWIQHLKSLEKNAIIAATGRAAHPCCLLYTSYGDPMLKKTYVKNTTHVGATPFYGYCTIEK